MRSTGRARNKELALETLEILESGEYTSDFSHFHVDIRSQQQLAVESSLVYRPNHVWSVKPAASYATSIRVCNCSTIDAIIDLAKHGGANVGALNFASARNPGGGFLKGSQAQEESLARSSGLYPCLVANEEMYRHHRKHKSMEYSHYMIYSPNVPLIRDHSGKKLDEPIPVSIITSPAVNAKVLRQRESGAKRKIAAIMQERIQRILHVASFHGVTEV